MLYDNDTFEHNGRTFRVEFPYDDLSGDAPWDRSDGHGAVSDWTTRDKLPGERVLVSDRGPKRFYDVAETTRIAKRDGWGLGRDDEAKLAQSIGRAPTRKQIIAAAVEADFEFLRGWCNDEWHYCGVVVRHAESGDSESLWGIEDNAHEYLEEVAHELAGEICARLDDEMAADIAASPIAQSFEARPGV